MHAQVSMACCTCFNRACTRMHARYCTLCIAIVLDILEEESGSSEGIAAVYARSVKYGYIYKNDLLTSAMLIPAVNVK